jgi:hypothetical protein
MLNRAARTTCWTFLLGTLTAGSAVLAQAPTAPAAPAAPNAPAAPTAPAVKPCTAPEYRQFDFWIGSWEVKNPKGGIEGYNKIESIQEGCSIQEHWDNKPETGTSLNVYDAGAHKWHQTWIDNSGGLLLLNGEFSGGKMTLSGSQISRKDPTKTILNRITWTPIDANHVRQFWEVSRDGGKTWVSNFDGMYTRQ